MEKVICKSCKKEFTIIEKPIQRGGRDTETAECPYCNIEIYKGKTSGTFEVIESKEDIKNHKK